MAFMSLKDIDVCYDKKKQILKGLSLDVEKGELVSLLGPSGCVKSTTLRVVAGFIDPQGGSFLLDGEDMTKVPVHKRNFGLVFQSYALFPHLSVYDNVAFGLRTRKMDKELIDKKVKDIFDSLKNKEFKNIQMEILSMGMTHDYHIAIEEGSNFIRIGEGIFGKRNYNLQEEK